MNQPRWRIIRHFT